MSVLTNKKRPRTKTGGAASKPARRGTSSDWKKFFADHPPVIANGPTDLSTREGLGR